MKNVYGIVLLLVGVLFISTESVAQYCTPRTSSTWGYINSVKTTGGTININKSGTTSAGYRNYTTTDSIASNYGQTFTVEVKFTRSFLCWIDWNDDGDFGDAGEKIKAGPSSTGNSVQTSTFNVTVPNNAAYGKLRMRVYSNYYYYATIGRDNAGCGYSSYQGEVEDYRLWIPKPKKNDAGITELTPAAACVGNNPVKVRIANFGLDTMKTVVVSGTIKEIGGATTTYGPTTLTSMGLARLQDSLYQVTTYNFLAGKTYDLDFKTTKPNNSTDSTSSNDAISRAGFAVALGGTYTIGGSSSADFSTFKAAEAAMAAVGICAATVFNVEAGTYNEQVKFGTYVGISATNNVRFRPDPSNTAPVRLTFSSNSSTNRGTVIFTSTQHIAIDSITIEAKGASYANVIQFASAPKNLSFTGDSLLGNQTTTSTSNYVAIVYDYQTFAENMTFRHNVMLGGSCTFYIYGASSSSQTGGYYTVEDNIMTGWNFMCFYMYYRKNNTINRNVISNSGRYNYPRAIYAYYCNNTSISGNNIQVKAANYGYGIYHYRCYGTSSSVRQKVQNNMISITGGSGYHYGLYSRDANYTDYDFNSISIEKGNAYPVYLYRGTGVNFRNNVMASGGTYYRYYQSGSQTRSNNVWWAPNATRSSGSLGSSLLNVDPKFKSKTNLHSTSTACHNSGVAVTGVTKDIDGEIRCPGTGCPGAASAPDRGADEYYLPNYDASPSSLGLSPCSGTQDIKIQVSNAGLVNMTSFRVDWSIAGVAQTALVVSSSSLAAGADTIVTLGSHTFVSGISYNMVYRTSLPSGRTDQQMSNDTLKESLKNALAGNLRIGSGGDYPGLDDAAKALMKLGICGPVTLQLLDSTFKETVTFKNIAGNSSVNPISIVSHPSNTNMAIIEGSVTLTGVTHFTIKGVEFIGTNNTIVVKDDKVTNVKIDSNVFTLGTSGYAFYDGNPNTLNMDSVWFTNNKVNGGYGGLYIYGGSSTRESNIVIENNKIEGFVQYGIYFWYGKNLSLRGNTVKSAKGLGSYPYAVYSWYINNLDITENHLHVNGLGGGYGIYARYLNYSGASTSDSLVMTNNFISVAHTQSDYTHYGAYMYYCYRTKAYHNNFNVESSYSNAYALYTYRNNGSAFKNNILGTKGATTWRENYSSLTRDYNAYWNGSVGVSGINGGRLGSNSIVTNHRYKKPQEGDLRVNSLQLDSAGVNLGVRTDIFGSIRNNPPDIGAYEFDPCYYDAVAMRYYARYVQIPNSQSVRMYGTVGNLGLDSITGVNANGSVGTSSSIVPLGTIKTDSSKSFSLTVPLVGISGNVNATLFTTLDSTDCDLLNDTLKYSFEASDSVYAYDDSVFNNTLGYNYPNTGEFGSIFEIFNTDTITSGTFRLDGPTQGATVRLLVYNYIDSTNTPGAVIDSTRKFVVGKVGTGWYTLEFGCAGVVATPGKYLVTIEQSNPVRMNLAINTDGVGVEYSRWERGTGGTWNDLYASSSSAVKNAVLGLRVNLGEVASNDVLPSLLPICNNSSTYLKMNKKYARQIWSNGLLFDSILVTNPGVYKVTAWDAIGCVFTDSTTAAKATPMIVTGTPTQATCGLSDGSVSLAITGAYPPHTYSWNNGDTSKNISGVSGDDYTVIVTDSLGCQNSQSVKVLGAFPIVSGMWTYPTCNGDNNGTATSNVNKGVMPYTYKWNTGGSTSNSTNTNLPSGSYIVDVTDASGCVTKDTVVVQDPAVLVTNNVVIAPTACKLPDASAEAQMNGGLAPYNFLWSDGQTSGKAVGLTKGVYDVTITDSLGCVVISKMRVTDPNSPVSIPNDLLLDCSYDTTTVKVNILGGTAPFNYTWDYRNTRTSAIGGVTSGRYKLHLVDAKGCDHDTIVVISAPTAINVKFDNIVDSAGVQKATANTSGGSPAYSWNWSPSGETTQRAVKLISGVNTVEVVDAKGCSFTYQLNVIVETTSISYLNNPAVFNIYPNPTEGNVYVDLNLNSEDNVRIRVLNSLGKVVETIERDNVVQDKFTIDLSNYSVGIYVVETTIGSEKVVSRIQLTK